ncbi:hypothetical protein ACFO4O_15260 [Glaciecola siphonariae]|uniref:Uncharacterized protein n=1 Tax=Glaciecola siphonariae TaxID=521012 RepID=A0ABV9M0C4_9ALTE
MDRKYAGMTVNERLYVAGLFDQFDRAVSDKDRDKVREILIKVELDDNSIIPILKELGLE